MVHLRDRPKYGTSDWLLKTDAGKKVLAEAMASVCKSCPHRTKKATQCHKCRKENQNASELLDRLPPHSAECEQAVIGSVLLDNSVYSKIEPKLESREFYIIQNALVWDVIRSRLDNGMPVDTIILIEELKARGHIHNFDNAYFADALASVGAPSNCNFYAEIVRTNAYNRRVIDALLNLLPLAYDSKLSARSKMLLEILEHAAETATGDV